MAGQSKTYINEKEEEQKKKESAVFNDAHVSRVSPPYNIVLAAGAPCGPIP